MCKLITWIATLLSAIGAINWGMTAFLKFNIPYVLSTYAESYAGIPGIEAFIYGLVTASGVWVLISLFTGCKK